MPEALRNFLRKDEEPKLKAEWKPHRLLPNAQHPGLRFRRGARFFGATATEWREFLIFSAANVLHAVPFRKTNRNRCGD
jgi:hypothetical protein